MSRVLVIDDDRAICRSLEIQLANRGHEVATAVTGSDGLDQAGEGAPDIVFLDLRLPDVHGLKVLERLVAEHPRTAVVMITGEQDMKATIDAIRKGAFDFIRKPLDLDEILLAIEKVERRNALREDAQLVPLKDTAGPAREIVGKHRAIITVLKQIGLVSKSPVTVLVQGESGTGKELVARAIHEASDPSEPFVALNCASIVGNLWESELFGHERGAFTGADRRKLGKLEQARAGTIFFDEIGDLPLELQAKLLRALQEREFERVGSNETIPLRARIVAATNRELEAAVEQGEFRLDLLHRLSVAHIRVPPLRERKEDIPLLVEHLLARIGVLMQREIHSISTHALRKLEAHDWPGNVRELQNVLMRSVALCHEEILDDVDCPGPAAQQEASRNARGAALRTLRQAERDHVREVLDHLEWNITHSARTLGISPTTLRKKIADYRLEPPPE